MYTFLRRIAANWSEDPDKAGIPCDEFVASDNEIISSQGNSEVTSASKMGIVEENVIESDEGTEKIFGAIAEIYEDEGASVIDTYGRTHFVETRNIVANKNIKLIKGDRVGLNLVIFGYQFRRGRAINKMQSSLTFSFVAGGSQRSNNRKWIWSGRKTRNLFDGSANCHNSEWKYSCHQQ